MRHHTLRFALGLRLSRSDLRREASVRRGSQGDCANTSAFGGMERDRYKRDDPPRHRPLAGTPLESPLPTPRCPSLHNG